MKVFISWSGATSHKVALILRDWLPSVIQSIDPYVSSEDIDKGARWSSDIAGELDSSNYGIICLTPDNLDAPWINFEAGALGKSVDKSRVSPLLFRLKRADVQGPLVQFQSTTVDREDMWKLMNSINNACGDVALDEPRLSKAFQTWWPGLEKDLDSIANAEAAKDNDSKAATPKEIASILEELLDLTRANTKLLREPNSIASRDVFEELGHLRARLGQSESTFEMLLKQFRTIRAYIEANIEGLASNQAAIELVAMLEDIEPPVIFGRSHSSWYRKINYPPTPGMSSPSPPPPAPPPQPSKGPRRT